MIKYLKKLFRQIKYGIVNNDYNVLIHGFYDNNSIFWRETREKDLIKYALNNPRVFKYNFGHKELIEKHLKEKDII